MAIFIGGHTYNPMTGLVLKYLMENPKLDNNDVYPFMPKCMKYRLGYIALVARDGDVIRNADTKRRLAVICDDGEGMLPENAAPFISRFPFMLDLHLRANSETDLTRYAGAEIVSMDKETLDFLNSEPSSLRQNYKWNDIVVNHGLHSVWFGDKITDFKYHDGVENECTYESKREIVAGLAAEYALNDYKMSDKGSVHVAQRVFRDYWAPHLEYERRISNDEALKILDFKRVAGR